MAYHNQVSVLLCLSVEWLHCAYPNLGINGTPRWEAFQAIHFCGNIFQVSFAKVLDLYTLKTGSSERD